MKKVIITMLMLFSVAAHADPSLVVGRGVRGCELYATVFLNIATDLRNGITLKSEAAYRESAYPASIKIRWIEQSVAQVYNSPQVTPDTWFGYELAYCEALPPKSAWIIVAAPRG